MQKKNLSICLEICPIFWTRNALKMNIRFKMNIHHHNAAFISQKWKLFSWKD